MADPITANNLDEDEEGSTQAAPRRSGRSDKEIPKNKKDRKEKIKTTTNEPSTSSASCSSPEPRYVTREEFLETQDNVKTILDISTNKNKSPPVTKATATVLATEEGEDEEDDDDDDEDMQYFNQTAGIIIEKGPDIKSSLSKGMTKILQEGLTKDNRKLIEDKYTTPGNCNRLTPVPCNRRIYKMVKKPVRIRDTNLQHIQNDITKGLTALAHAFTKTSSEEDEIKSRSTLIADAMSLVANASHSLDLFRRKAFRPHVSSEYQELCSDESKPVTDQLFGDLSEDVKNTAEDIKIAGKFVKQDRFSGNRYHPYKQPFLDNRGTLHGGRPNNFKQNNFNYTSGYYNQKKRKDMYRKNYQNYPQKKQHRM